jgi:hypothetical protein
MLNMTHLASDVKKRTTPPPIRRGIDQEKLTVNRFN